MPFRESSNPSTYPHMSGIGQSSQSPPAVDPLVPQAWGDLPLLSLGI